MSLQRIARYFTFGENKRQSRYPMEGICTEGHERRAHVILLPSP